MPDQRSPYIRRIVFTLAEAAPAPLSYEQLIGRRSIRARSKRGWKTTVATAVILLVVLGAPLIVLGWLRDPSPAGPRVTKAVRVTNLAFGSGFNTGAYVLSPDGAQAVVVEQGSWCIADLPEPTTVGEDLPVLIEGLTAGTQELRCADSPYIAFPSWSPDGTRIVAYGQEAPPITSPGLDPDLAQLYVLDASSLEVEAILDSALGTPPIWLNNSEVFVYDYQQSAFNVVPIDGSRLRAIPAPRPYIGRVVPVGDSTVAYATVNTETFGQDGAALDAKLIMIDADAGAATELAPLSDLNPEGSVPDPGFVTAMTSDLRYAVLMALLAANEFGQGPTTYVYDVANQVLIPHTAPGYGPQPRTSPPFLVGEAWVAYSAIPDPTTDEPDFHLNVFIAPLDDPTAGIELFQDGQLVAAQGDRLLILAENPVILELDF